jgi:lysozyme family protein
MKLQLTDALRQEYQQLFDNSVVRPERAAAVDSIAAKINQNRDRYTAVGQPLNIPWFFIGVVHDMESSLRFDRHLHNGDPLTARTVQVPAGRPASGNPPFTWEQSAADALTLEKLDAVADWSLPGLLYQLERYNGFGYRSVRPPLPTPYLWSFTNHYQKGKFVADGKFDPDAISGQCGAAAILRRMSELGFIQFDSTVNGQPAAPQTSTTTPSASPSKDLIESFTPLVTFSNDASSEIARNLQRALNTFPGISLRVDGVPGPKTSDAFRTVTGHFLTGDPRA